MCVSINVPGEWPWPLSWPFDLKTGMQVASKVGNLPSKFGLAIGFSNYSLCTRRTDGRTDGQKQRLSSPSLQAGHNKLIQFGLATSNLAYIRCLTMMCVKRRVGSVGRRVRPGGVVTSPAVSRVPSTTYPSASTSSGRSRLQWWPRHRPAVFPAPAVAAAETDVDRRALPRWRRRSAAGPRGSTAAAAATTTAADVTEAVPARRWTACPRLLSATTVAATRGRPANVSSEAVFGRREAVDTVPPAGRCFPRAVAPAATGAKSWRRSSGRHHAHCAGVESTDQVAAHWDADPRAIARRSQPRPRAGDDDDDVADSATWPRQPEDWRTNRRRRGDPALGAPAALRVRLERGVLLGRQRWVGTHRRRTVRHPQE